MKKSFKKVILSLLVSLSVIGSSFTTIVNAATPISSLPFGNIQTYLLSNSKVTTYDINTKKKNASFYAYGWEDVVKLLSYSGGYLKISCPNGKSYKTVLVKDTDVFASTSGFTRYKINKNYTVYTKYNSSKSFGTVTSGTNLYVLSGTKNGKVQIAYDLSAGGYKLGWISESAVKHVHNFVNSGSFESAHPHKGYSKCSCGQTQYNGKTYKYQNCTTCYPKVTTSSSQGFQLPIKNTSNYRGWKALSSRKYHVAVDLYNSSDKNVYSFGSGTVIATGFNSANGNYVVTKHTISGKAVYGFYAHLASISVSKNASVSKGQKIGVVGATGSCSNGITHTHFSLSDSLNSNGAYLGYISSDNSIGQDVLKITKGSTQVGYTFYNPNYVVSKGALPSK